MAKQLKSNPASLKVFKNKASNVTIDEAHPISFSQREMPDSFDDLVSILESKETFEIDARVPAFNPETNEWGIRKLNRKEFLEAVRQSKNNEVVLRESMDSFATDAPTYSNAAVGNDFVPIMGGPFFKNLYQRDFLKQANEAFYAYNHDPIAHQGVNLIKDFTLGRGYRIDSDNKAALSLWKAFEKVNNIQKLMDQFAVETPINGESMLWWLPNNQTTIVQNISPGQPVPKGILPRVRIIDSTVIWDVVTWPEDPTKPLYYVWLAPTQFQTYTSMDQGANVPSTKFIFQMIPAEQIDHYKINVTTGEKRGRSDLFSILGYLKRLRDSVSYSIVALQKQSAYSIDTTIKGSQEDINNYIADQEAQGSIAPAGSEFVHSDAITREYLGVQGGVTSASQSFEWCMSMIASGLGLPISYFGTHLSGGQTRGSAIVATEPVAKRFEMRQKLYEEVLQRLWARLMEWAGIAADCEVTFPELITQDRSAKFKDLALAEAQGWISKERAANIAAKELGISDFDFEKESESTEESEDDLSPLTSDSKKSPLSLSSTQRAEIKKNDG